MVPVPDFDYLKISISSPAQVRRWGMRTLPDGSKITPISNSETLHYRTFKPVPGGLFCDRIFGPERDWKCRCGKCSGKRKKDVVCPKCHVQVTTAHGRRHYIGLIDLGTPVTHIWYLLGKPSYLSDVLDIEKKNLLKLAYYACHVVLSPDKPQADEIQHFKYKQFVTQQREVEAYRRLRCLKRGLRPWEDLDEDSGLVTATGGSALKTLLEESNLIEIFKELQNFLQTMRQKSAYNSTRGISKRESSILRKKRRRFRIITHFLTTQTNPAWMLIEVLPVLPPLLRPLIRIDGVLLNADLNEFYRWILIRNNRLKRCLMTKSPLSLLDSERHLIQESVDSLIQNGKRGKPLTDRGKRPLKSLTDIIKGKEGRFRQNLLGKRVDYSARSVIVVGAWLHNYQCGLPREIAVELFTSFLVHQLVRHDLVLSYSQGLRLVSQRDDILWDVLANIILAHPVLLNRAPSLHRQNIQAFWPVLVYEKAIKLPPIVCSGYNADFDGDQMAVHLPLALEAQFEAYRLMTPMNFLSPKGNVALAPSQDMIIGAKYLTESFSVREGTGLDSYFSSADEVLKAYQNSSITLHTNVWMLLDTQDVPKYTGLSIAQFFKKATLTKEFRYEQPSSGVPYGPRCDRAIYGHQTFHELHSLRCIVHHPIDESAHGNSIKLTFYYNTSPGLLLLNKAIELTP